MTATISPVPTGVPTPPARRTATVVMACLGVFVAYLPITSVAVTLPAIGTAFGASTAQLSWVQDAFVLPMAAFILTAGVFGDVHGRRKVYLVGPASRRRARWWRCVRNRSAWCGSDRRSPERARPPSCPRPWH
nr:MFS transporter [Gordonia sp. UCD-TK1]